MSRGWRKKKPKTPFHHGKTPSPSAFDLNTGFGFVCCVCIHYLALTDIPSSSFIITALKTIFEGWLEKLSSIPLRAFSERGARGQRVHGTR